MKDETLKTKINQAIETLPPKKPDIQLPILVVRKEKQEMPQLNTSIPSPRAE